MHSDSLSLPEPTFKLLRDLIHERVGIQYDDPKRDILANKLSARVIELGFGSFLDYYYLLKYDDPANQEWQRVINLLSVPETFFWREMAQIKAVVSTIVPQLARAGTGPIRIWCAACATGEEPLTIAMALHEAGLLQRLNIQIHASDASSTAIDKARRGIYRERSFRSIPPLMRSAYFRPVGSDWQIDPALQQRIHWRVANITVAAEISDLSSAPIIFCRNAFIYFSEAMVRRTVEQFWQRMPTPGYLCLGAAESLLRYATRFELKELDQAFVYVK